MKVSASLKIIDKGWVRKAKGYRVRFQQKTEIGLETDHCPGLKEIPLDSDVVAWRLAWKLAVSTATQGPAIKEGEIVNICVVDDLGDPIKYYVTNNCDLLNPKTV
jgi:hypothetical protein